MAAGEHRKGVRHAETVIGRSKGDSLRQLGESGVVGLYRAVRVLPDP
ncbi:hypothetical protein Psuf_018620 [Phytohabitans suffuscus]|uniref:Uncharacterized protein n=1 Tax=Phytohabitans suffuscus TaxID=624315 RepID=A0A6F8YEV7_9ACTN|nr:hypothetical protein Psuf_018620 [Phytohabitans suffuscus]